MIKKLLLAAAALCSLAACQTTIPQTDTTPPVITMLVQGPAGQCIQSSPGGGHEADCPITYGFNDTLTFELSVKDSGGVKLARIAVPSQFEAYDALTSPNSTLRVTYTPSSTVITAVGDSSHPVDQIVITGKITTGNIPARPYLTMSAEDFGGQSRTPNRTEWDGAVISVAAP